MTHIKINGATYPATVASAKAGPAWGGRNMKSISLEMDHATAVGLFVDDVKWSVIFSGVEVKNADTGEIVTTDPVEVDYSDYCLAGPITDKRDGTVTVNMGQPTDSELLAILMGGN